MLYKAFFNENKDVLGIMVIFIDVTNIKKEVKILWRKREYASYNDKYYTRNYILYWENWT